MEVVYTMVPQCTNNITDAAWFPQCASLYIRSYFGHWAWYSSITPILINCYWLTNMCDKMRLYLIYISPHKLTLCNQIIYFPGTPLWFPGCWYNTSITKLSGSEKSAVWGDVYYILANHCPSSCQLKPFSVEWWQKHPPKSSLSKNLPMLQKSYSCLEITWLNHNKI